MPEIVRGFNEVDIQAPGFNEHGVIDNVKKAHREGGRKGLGPLETTGKTAETSSQGIERAVASGLITDAGDQKAFHLGQRDRVLPATLGKMASGSLNEQAGLYG